MRCTLKYRTHGNFYKYLAALPQVQRTVIFVEMDNSFERQGAAHRNIYLMMEFFQHICIKAGIAGAKVAASEQNLFKSDKGSGIFPLNKPEVAQAVFAHTFILRVGGFASAYYWSSSEYSSNNAWKQNFNNGNQNNNNKNNTNYVRAVRGFKQIIKSPGEIIRAFF